MKTIFTKWGGVKPSKCLAKWGLLIVFMYAVNSIQAQNTFTVNSLAADSANVSKAQIQQAMMSKADADTLTAGTIKVSDSLYSNHATHQNAQIKGNIEVSGSVIAKTGILMDTNNVGVYKMYLQLPKLDSTQANANSRSAFISAGPLSPNDLNPPIDYDPCEGGQLVDPNTQQGSGGFIAKGVRAPSVNATIGMWVDWWTGNGMIDVMGQGLYGANHGLYVNYNCGKNIYLGTGFGNGGDWQGKAGSKIYTGDYVEMRKKLQIGSPQWGTAPDPNNIALEVHVNSGTGIRAKTYTINDPMLSVFNTNSGGGDLTISYNGRNTFVVYGDGKTKIRSLNTVEPMLSIGKFNNSSSSDMGTEYFKVYADGRTYIGNKKIKTTNVHSDAILQVAGKIGAMELVLLDPLTKWADFVFDKDYKLLSISEVEKYIQKEKHLPDIPTAKDIQEEGMNVNDLMPKLLQKIEEQMLYIIELNRKTEKIEKENEQLKKQIQKYEKK